MGENGNGKTTERRITSVEVMQGVLCKDVDDLQKDVKKILENHLPHIKTDVESLSRLVKWSTGGILTAIFINIVLNYLHG